MSDATSGKVEAAKKKAAAFDKAGILNLAREAWGMGEAIDDSMLLEMLMKKLSMDDMEMESKTEPDATAPPALPEAADTQAADEDAGCGPKKPFGASRITLDESGDVKANIEKRDRIVEAVRTAARIGSITEPMLDDAAVFACHDVERFERIFCAPKAGRIINTTAADRKAQVPQTWAERETAVHRFAAQHRLSVAEARKQMEG